MTLSEELTGPHLLRMSHLGRMPGWKGARGQWVHSLIPGLRTGALGGARVSCDSSRVGHGVFRLQGKEPSVRQLALLHFRNAITLSVKLEEALARTHARVPPAIVQMLLVLQVRGGLWSRCSPVSRALMDTRPGSGQRGVSGQASPKQSPGQGWGPCDSQWGVTGYSQEKPVWERKKGKCGGHKRS